METSMGMVFYCTFLGRARGEKGDTVQRTFANALTQVLSVGISDLEEASFQFSSLSFKFQKVTHNLFRANDQIENTAAIGITLPFFS